MVRSRKRMRPRSETGYRTRRIKGKTFHTSRRAFDDLTIMVKRFPTSAAQGPVFVLVHGIGVSSRYYQPVAAELAAHGTVFLIDLPGYGAAPNPRRDVSLADHAHVLADFLNDAKIDNPVLVGHSMGGQVVTQLAVDSPEVTDRIVLMGSTMPDDARTPTVAGWRLFRDMLREPPSANFVVLTDYVFRCGIRYYLKQLPHLLADRIEDRLPVVRARTLVIRGDRDPVVPADWAQRVSDLVPDSRLETVRGPHVVMFTDPIRVAALIVEHASR